MELTRKCLLVPILVLAFSLTAVAGDFFEAIQYDDLEKVAGCLKKNPEWLNKQDENGLTPISLAAREGSLEVARFLIDRGADIHLGDCDSSQPIHLAAIGGSEEATALLLKHGVDLNVQDNNGVSPLHFAINFKKPWVASFLIEQGADIELKNDKGWTALIYSVMAGHEKTVRLLIDKGADVNAVTHEGLIALHTAASFGRKKIFNLLLEHGADINKVTNRGASVLGYALNPNTYDIAKQLIENGADIYHQNNRGGIPLHEVCERGSRRIAELFLERGVDVNVADNNGWTPLTYAVFGGPEMVDFLLANGADPNPCNKKDNFTAPLHMAVRHGSPEVCKALLKGGACVNTANSTGDTPLHIAAIAGNPEIMQALLAQQCDVNKQENLYGRTALHNAVIAGYTDMAKPLLAHRADVCALDKAKMTPLDHAMLRGFGKLACFLGDHGADKTKLEGFDGKCKMLGKELGNREALVWHLEHSGWAIKTAHHLLIFDYFIRDDRPMPPEFSLASGYIKPEELKDLNVCVFASHVHGDHYSDRIFDWKEQIPNIEYVIGFEPQGIDKAAYTFVGPRTQKKLGKMKISTIAANDSGVGFLVQVDGMNIFHSGDHANRTEDLSGDFCPEIDYLCDLGVPMDLAFFPISGCGFGAPENVKKGVYYAVEKLKPRVFMPMHSGTNFLRYQEFADEMKSKNLPTRIAIATYRGDHLFFGMDEKTISRLD